MKSRRICSRRPTRRFCVAPPPTPLRCSTATRSSAHSHRRHSVSWTDGRRISGATTFSLVLVAIMDLIGFIALQRTSNEYGEAISQERSLVLDAYEGRGLVRAANTALLVDLLTGDVQYEAERDSALAAAGVVFRRLQQNSPTAAQAW